MGRWRLSSAILASICIHTALLLISTRSAPPPRQEVHTVQPVEVEYESPSRRRRAGEGQPALSLRSLTPQFKLGGTGPRTSPTGNATDLESNPWGSGGTRFSEVQHYPRYEHLAREIEGLLNYPFVLSRRKIDGTINVRLAFTDDSKCDWKRIRILGLSSHLKVYIKALLIKLCGLSVVRSLRADKSRVVDLSFQFEITDRPPSPEEVETRSAIIGNVLNFYRFSLGAGEYRAGPIRGHWYLPAVSLDFEWILENWEKYVNGNDLMAPFKEE